MNATAMTKLYSYYELSLSLYLESEETLIAVLERAKADKHTDNSGDDTFIEDTLFQCEINEMTDPVGMQSRRGFVM